MVSEKEKKMGKLAHLLTFCGYIVPLGNLIAPLVVSRLNRQSDYVRYHGRVAFDFQVVFTFLAAVGIVLWLLAADVFGESSPEDRWKWAAAVCGIVVFILFVSHIVRYVRHHGWVAFDFLVVFTVLVATGIVLWLLVADVPEESSPEDRWKWVAVVCGIAAFIQFALHIVRYVRQHEWAALDFPVIITVLVATGVMLLLLVAGVSEESSESPTWEDRWNWVGVVCGIAAVILFAIYVMRAANSAGNGVFCTYPATIEGLVRNIDTIVGRGSGLAFAGLVLPMVGGLCYEVFARYLFNAPTIWAYDVTYMLYGSHFMLGAAYTLYKGSHIRTDMLYENFPLRWKGRVDASMYLVFFFPGMLFFMFAGWDEALHSWGIGERSDASPWRPVIYPFKTAVSVAAALLIIQGVSEFLKSAYAAIKGEPLIEIEPPALRGDII